ncbi:MAG: hypothetical protein ACI8RO_002298, partial [Flavobacteriales bacterium]
AVGFLSVNTHLPCSSQYLYTSTDDTGGRCDSQTRTVAIITLKKECTKPA